MGTLTDELKQLMEREHITAGDLAARLKLKPKTVQPWVTTGKSHTEPLPLNQARVRQLLHPETQTPDLPALVPATSVPSTPPETRPKSATLPQFNVVWQGKTIRDPVQMDVELTTVETKVIDTPEFQRLRHIKELGTASLVFPGATHTRFEHSLGTLAVAQHMIEAINRNATPSIDQPPGRLPPIELAF